MSLPGHDFVSYGIYKVAYHRLMKNIKKSNDLYKFRKIPLQLIQNKLQIEVPTHPCDYILCLLSLYTWFFIIWQCCVVDIGDLTYHFRPSWWLLGPSQSHVADVKSIIDSTKHNNTKFKVTANQVQPFTHPFLSFLSKVYFVWQATVFS